jgi:hypothetical protein
VRYGVANFNICRRHAAKLFRAPPGEKLSGKMERRRKFLASGVG